MSQTNEIFSFLHLNAVSQTGLTIEIVFNNAKDAFRFHVENMTVQDCKINDYRRVIEFESGSVIILSWYYDDMHVRGRDRDILWIKANLSEKLEFLLKQRTKLFTIEK